MRTVFRRFCVFFMRVQCRFFKKFCFNCYSFRSQFLSFHFTLSMSNTLIVFCVRAYIHSFFHVLRFPCAGKSLLYIFVENSLNFFSFFVFLFMGIYLFLFTCLTDTWKICIKVVHMCRLNCYVRNRKLLWSEKNRKYFTKENEIFLKHNCPGWHCLAIVGEFLSYSKLVIIELMNSD